MTATQHVHDGHKVDYDGQSMMATNYDGHINDDHKVDHDGQIHDGH